MSYVNITQITIYPFGGFILSRISIIVILDQILFEHYIVLCVMLGTCNILIGKIFMRLFQCNLHISIFSLITTSLFSAASDPFLYVIYLWYTCSVNYVKLCYFRCIYSFFLVLHYYIDSCFSLISATSLYVSFCCFIILSLTSYFNIVMLLLKSTIAWITCRKFYSFFKL